MTPHVGIKRNKSIGRTYNTIFLQVGCPGKPNLLHVCLSTHLSFFFCGWKTRQIWKCRHVNIWADLTFSACGRPGTKIYVGSPFGDLNARSRSGGKNWDWQKLGFFTLLRKLLNCLAYRLLATAAASQRYLPCPPLTEMTVNGLGWLLYASVPGGGHQSGRGMVAAAMVEKWVCQSFC